MLPVQVYPDEQNNIQSTTIQIISSTLQVNYNGWIIDG
jgi:hypothetical protein